MPLFGHDVAIIYSGMIMQQLILSCNDIFSKFNFSDNYVVKNA